MRVFCQEHKRGFFAPRQSPIQCENRGHTLGELDFTGEGKSVLQTQWQYCCNCEHFCVVNVVGDDLQRCPVCTRRSSTLFLCDRCYTISFESNTPLQTKNFTLTAEGAPQPCCPGCLHPAAADLREHTCEEARISFVTALTTCPVCEERLDIAPTFPSLVGQYLRRTKSANKVSVTFDYESGLFLPVEDGEFVVISNNDGSGRTIVVPRSPRLASLRDFYDLYQDYYHCASPATGEITIHQPAVVEQTREGWRLQAPGTFVVVNDQPKLVVPSERSDRPVREKPQHAFSEPEESTTPCPQCKTPIEVEYSFCWKCGGPRLGTNQPGGRPERSRVIVSSEQADDDEARTVQQVNRSRLSRGFLMGSAEPPVSQPRLTGSVLKLFAIAIGGLLLISLAIFAMKRSDARSTSATAVQTDSTRVQNSTTSELTPNADLKPATLHMDSRDIEDTAIGRLRQMQGSANGNTRAKMLQDLSETEMKYADDYRFPYERAKLVVMDHKKNFQKEAFAALARAAQKAINKGKAREMLHDLTRDSDGDFQKLSHGHREWAQLEKALKSKNATVLSVNEGL